jgi:sarcosine oxidase
MGSATAWWLARRGREVVLVDQFGAGHDRGSSHGSTRIFRFAYPDVDYVTLAQAALPMWREVEDDAGETLLEITGAVDHGAPKSVDATAAALAQCGARHELLSPAAAAERWPHMVCDSAVLFHPDGGRCLAGKSVAALQRRAADHGADVRLGVGRATVRVDGDAAVVRAGDDEWRAPVAVVTAGAWIAGTIGESVQLPPLRVSLEQVQHFRPRHASDAEAAAWPSFIHHRAPWVYGLYSPGEGLKAAQHHVGPEVDPDSPDRPSDAALLTTAVAYVERWFPGLDPEPVGVARCLYTSTANEDFVLDRAGPIVVGSPCSGHGFKFTPLVGRILADLADGSTSPDWIPPRFRLPA